MNDAPDDHLSSPATCEHKGQHYHCIRDGIVSEAAWEAAPARIIYVLKQPKEKRSLTVGANEKAVSCPPIMVPVREIDFRSGKDREVDEEAIE